jgi:diguanylate cyclase (GGDEF)-like protein/PAS domain S-box-containing protein
MLAIVVWWRNAAVALRLLAFTCAAIVLLGTIGAGGWILESPLIVSAGLGMVPMVFSTGLCFILCGIALWLTTRDGRAARRICTVLAVAVMLLAGAALMEWWLDRSLSVDFEFLQTWYDYQNKTPGRMAPNTALAFVIIGFALLLAGRITSRNRALGIVVLTFAVLSLGLTGLAGYAMTPDLLFEWARSARMAVLTAVGMILCAGGLRLTWTQSRWYGSQKYFREDGKMLLLGPATLLVVAITAGLSGFVLQQNTLQTVLVSKLQGVRDERSALLHAALQPIRQKLLPERLARLAEAARKVLLAQDAGSSAEATAAIGAEMSDGTLRGILIESRRGAIVGAFGRPSAAPPITANLNAEHTAELLWDEDFILRTRMTLMNEGKPIGSLAVDQSAAALGKALFDVTNLGATTEIAACEQVDMRLQCFPGSRHAAPFSIELSQRGSHRLPMQLALAGGTGSVVAIDYRGQNVVASYGLLAPGLGFVVKQDAAELYAVIRRSLRFGAPLLAAIALLGATLLYLQLKPLAGQMLASEARAKEREAQMRAIVESVGEGILAFDARGFILEVNPAVCEIFGYAAGELIGKPTSLLMPDRSHESTWGYYNQHLQLRLVAMAGQRNVRLSGKRKDGSEFPLEATIGTTNSSGGPSFVGVVRDITERNEAERALHVLGKYDSLTALPNRSLFLEKLSATAERMNGTGTAIALMFIDVDGFKEINDSHGHPGGDDLLIQFAQRLLASVRDTDMVARLSGDEFTILLEGLTEPAADSRRVADKIVVSLEKPFILAGREVRATASLGLVTQVGSFNVAELLARADAAMYVAKRSGKNQVIAA